MGERAWGGGIVKVREEILFYFLQVIHFQLTFSHDAFLWGCCFWATFGLYKRYSVTGVKVASLATHKGSLPEPSCRWIGWSASKQQTQYTGAHTFIIR